MTCSWFRHSNYNSFQRQLNIYGFQRILTGRDKNSYYHDFFLRDQYELTFRISRIAIKGAEVRRSKKASNPNFYGAGNDVDNNYVSSEQIPTIESTPLLSLCHQAAFTSDSLFVNSIQLLQSQRFPLLRLSMHPQGEAIFPSIQDELYDDQNATLRALLSSNTLSFDRVPRLATLASVAPISRAEDFLGMNYPTMSSMDKRALLRSLLDRHPSFGP